MTSELVIIGGGLAGLMSAARAEAFGLAPILVDCGIPGTPGKLGGFAPFSGAKFSLFPAGTGLTPLVGSSDDLIRHYGELCSELFALGFPEFEVSPKQIIGENIELENGLAYRNYHSVVLTPARVDDLLSALTGRLAKTQIVRASVSRLALKVGRPFKVTLEGGDAIYSRAVIVAAGRLGAELLREAGVPETPGKGVDVGVRLGFPSRAPVAGLRKLGPDAKFIADGVRTFCLNSPGRIFHYPGLGFDLPGGVVAEPDWPESNVGILCRFDDRRAAIDRITTLAPPTISKLSQQGCGSDLGWTPQAASLLGDDAIGRLNTFIGNLVGSGLVDLPRSYTVHYPLLDWHWPVFSLPGRLATHVPGVLAAGDVSGHARGLMQAALMGELAIEELLS